ncbi:OLC1v1016945C1 [Oldenlandia corymbosa var. corymbosa]|uniref:OLC1v1016945C1 n=1 Tax=Oldenlandia corymbosa var. corymbosa TaxID=529605 RepID=A0AAV1E8E6_OLDCO|nr:OLC1v1016945C1 [Oldenlandia corymbosa var. corymbosa]
MTTQFDRWEKDPFFAAAEEVQESADRMESTYRTWIHALKDTAGIWNKDELRRDLQTALGTTKWQLDEFERAVSSSYTNNAADDSKDRRRDFVIAIGSQILKVETSLNESTASKGKPPLPWVRLDEGESDELAAFLSGPSTSFTGDRNFGRLIGRDPHVLISSHEADDKLEPNGPLNTSHPMELIQVEGREEKLAGHRRTASASADIGSWNISMAEDALPHSSADVQADPPPRKIPSVSGFLNSMEFGAKLKLSKNGYRKLKLSDRHKESDTPLPQTQPLTRGINSCYERSKSCLEGCDDCYDKQLYGWYGAIQRQIQRSQYHMQYSRPLQVILSTVTLLGIIAVLGLFAV